MYDELLLSLAQQHDNIQSVLHSLFSFFERRTDLFHVLAHPDDKMGFPPGMAENMVLNSFRKFQARYDDRTGQVSGVERENGNKEERTAPTPSASSTKPCEPPSEAVHKASQISTWNGAEVEGKYLWSQTLSELTVEIELPDRKLRANQLNVELKSAKLHIRVKDGDDILKGEFDERIKVEESMWTLSDGKLVLTLEKDRHTWWKCLLLGDPEIDTSKVESTKKVHEYDGETQGVLRKIVFDQNQKAQGKPTSDQIATAEIMKESWNAENSPFKGQPFDPGLLNIQGSPDFGR